MQFQSLAHRATDPAGVAITSVQTGVKPSLRAHSPVQASPRSFQQAMQVIQYAMKCKTRCNQTEEWR